MPRRCPRSPGAARRDRAADRDSRAATPRARPAPPRRHAALPRGCRPAPTARDARASPGRMAAVPPGVTARGGEQRHLDALGRVLRQRAAEAQRLVVGVGQDGHQPLRSHDDDRRSSPGDHRLQVLSRHHQAGAAAAVGPPQQRRAGPPRARPARRRRAPRTPCASGRSRCGTRPRSARPTGSGTRSAAVVCSICDAPANSSPQVRLGAPQQRRRHARHRRHVLRRSTRNIWPMKPGGVQFARPIRPPGRHTRISSRAACSWSGANMTPNVESTTSKLASGYGRSSASATSNTSRPSASARRRPRSSSAGT